MQTNSTSHTPFNDPPPLPAAGTVIGYADMPITKAPDWHGTIAWDALLNGMATGLFLAAAISELAAPEVFTTVAKVAYPVSLVVLLIDLGTLVLDLGDPLRFHHMLRVFKPVSPMSMGTWSLAIFSLPLTAAAALSLLSEMGYNFELVRKLVVVVGLIPGFCSAAYKGVLLSTNAQPGWKDARWMDGYLTNSALLLGCAQLLVLSALMGQAQAAATVRTAFIVLLVLNVIPLGLLFANLRPTFARLFTREQRWRVGLLTFAAATLIPVGLMLFGDGPVLVFGAMYLMLKTEGVVHDRSTRYARALWAATVPLLLAISIESGVVRPDLLGHAMANPFWWLGLFLVCGAVVTLISGLTTRREMRAFIGSNLLLAGLIVTGAAAIFPVVLHSTLAPENSLTAYDVAAPTQSFLYASIWWPIGFALAATYFVFVSRQYAGKVSVQRDNQGYY